jgi:hypothetical protein
MRQSFVILLLFIGIESIAQERKQGVSVQFSPSISQLWRSPLPDHLPLYSNSAGIEYRFTPWKNWLRFHVGVNYMERGYRLEFENDIENMIVIGSEKFMLLGLKTSASVCVKGFMLEVGTITQGPFHRRFKFDGELLATDVGHLPELAIASYGALGYKFKLRPRLYMSSQLFVSATETYALGNFGLSLSLEYQFGKEIIPNKNFNL